MEERLATFLEFLKRENNYSDNTIAAYRNDLNQFLRFLYQYPGLDSWQDVIEDMVQSYVKSLKDQPYASSSVARKVAAVKSFFHYLLARNLITDDPTKELDSPKVKKRLPQTLPVEEVSRLLEAPLRKNSPKNMRDSALLHLLYATGMRVTEVVTLQLDNVDLENRILRCQTKEAFRELPFDPLTHDTVARYLREGRPHLMKNDKENALFLNHRGNQLTRQGLWLIIKAYAKEAKLSVPVTPHTLRHSFAAHKLTNGIELKDVQKLLGHANISTTQIYSQLNTSAEEVTET